MYLLYLDESGNEDDPADKHFVLAGAAVFERQVYFLSKSLDDIQARHFPGTPPVEFHIQHIRSGKGFWRHIDETRKRAVLDDLGKAIGNANDPGVVLFAAVIEKSAQLYGEKAVELATERVCKGFDILLMSRYHEEREAQRGLMIFSEGRFHHRAKIWVKGFRELGTRLGAIKNLCDIPYFASSSETRLLQVADYVAHAAYLLYERRNADLVRPILDRFSKKDGTLHGLIHVKTDKAIPCDCPACHSRARPGNHGSWV